MYSQRNKDFVFFLKTRLKTQNSNIKTQHYKYYIKGIEVETESVNQNE